MIASAPHWSLVGVHRYLANGQLSAVSAGVAGARQAWESVMTMGASTRVDGRLVLAQAMSGDRSWLHVEETVRGLRGDGLRTEARIQVDNDALGSLRQWSLHSVALDEDGQARPLTRVDEVGRVRGKKVLREGSLSAPFERSDAPLTCLWSLLFAFPRLVAAEAAKVWVVDWLDGLTVYRPDLRLQPAGKVDWLGVSLRGWRLLGPGDAPIHLWVGPDAAVWFVCQDGRSWVREGLVSP